MAKQPKSNKTADAKGGKARGRHTKPADGLRETIESIVVAFILAFLFRTFLAEAFVIPTGSMAPTLYGRHKDVTCEKCGYHFAVGASDEVDSPGYLNPHPDREGEFQLLEDVTCPNCRYVTPKEIVQKLPAFKGDRILVNKYPYEFGDPQRWDVVVFKYPEKPHTNYIKRLVGTPGDALEIRQGDVYNRTRDGKTVILRKDNANKQRKLQVLVYDNDHAPHDLLKAGWPECWAAVKPKPVDAIARKIARYGYQWPADKDGWKADAEKRTFSLSGANELRWFRYRNFVPQLQDWQTVLNGGKPDAPGARLITDFCGYNAYTGGNPKQTLDPGIYWVGDLTINCEVDVEDIGSEAQLLLELIEGQRTYRCRFDLNSGECTIFYVDENQDISSDEFETRLGTAGTRLKGTGKHHVAFANVDDRLCVWVDDRLVDFGDNEDGTPKSHYSPFGNGKRPYQAPSPGDVTPVGIAARGCDVTVSKLLLQRDIYYRAEGVSDERDFSEQPASTLEYSGEAGDRFPDLSSRLTDPNAWWEQFSGDKFDRETGQFDENIDEKTGKFTHPHLHPAQFPRLGPNEYFMMGDNSPRSQDSRIWPNEYRKAKHRFAVPRSALVGKAFYIYWPHGKPFLNGGKGFPVLYHHTLDGKVTKYPSFRFPFYPNFKRMRRIW